jgi:secretion/DNA translocation related TadE-like protein
VTSARSSDRRLAGSVAERGSVSVLAASFMVALVVLALGASDVARVLSAAAAAQTAADAAALAAAQELALPSGVSPGDVAKEYAERNGAELLSCSCPSNASAAIVEVRVSVGRLLLFGSDRVVTAQAKAVVDRPT